MAESPTRVKLESIKEDPYGDVESTAGVVGIPDPRQSESAAALFPSYGFIGRHREFRKFLCEMGTPRLWEVSQKWEKVYRGPRSCWPKLHVLRANLEKHGFPPKFVTQLVDTAGDFRPRNPTKEQLREAAAEAEECGVFRPPNIPAKRNHIPKLPWGYHDVYDHLASPNFSDEGPAIRPNNFMGNLPEVERYLEKWGTADDIAYFAALNSRLHWDTNSGRDQTYIPFEWPTVDELKDEIKSFIPEIHANAILSLFRQYIGPGDSVRTHLDANANPLPIVKKKVSGSRLYIEKEPFHSSTMTLVSTDELDTEESGPEVDLATLEISRGMNKVEPAEAEVDQPPEMAMNGAASAVNANHSAQQTPAVTANAAAAAATATIVDTKKEANVKDLERFLEGTREPKAFQGVRVGENDLYLENRAQSGATEPARDDEVLWNQEVFVRPDDVGQTNPPLEEGEYVSENEDQTDPKAKPSMAQEVESLLQTLRKEVDANVTNKAKAAAAALRSVDVARALKASAAAKAADVLRASAAEEAEKAAAAAAGTLKAAAASAAASVEASEATVTSTTLWGDSGDIEDVSDADSDDLEPLDEAEAKSTMLFPTPEGEWVRLPIEAIGPHGLDTCDDNLKTIYNTNEERVALTHSFIKRLSIRNTAPHALNYLMKRIRIKLWLANSVFREAKLRYKENLERLKELLALKATWKREEPSGDKTQWTEDGKRLMDGRLIKEEEVDKAKNLVVHRVRESRKWEDLHDYAQKRFIDDMLEQVAREISTRRDIATTPPAMMKGLRILRGRAFDLRQDLERHPKTRDEEADARHEAQDAELHDLWLNYNKWTMNGATRRSVMKRALKRTEKLATDKDRLRVDKIKAESKEGRAWEPDTEALRQEVPVVAAMVPRVIPSNFDPRRHDPRPKSKKAATMDRVGAKGKPEVESEGSNTVNSMSTTLRRLKEGRCKAKVMMVPNSSAGGPRDEVAEAGPSGHQGYSEVSSDEDDNRGRQEAGPSARPKTSGESMGRAWTPREEPRAPRDERESPRLTQNDHRLAERVIDRSKNISNCHWVGMVYQHAFNIVQVWNTDYTDVRYATLFGDVRDVDKKRIDFSSKEYVAKNGKPLTLAETIGKAHGLLLEKNKRPENKVLSQGWFMSGQIKDWKHIKNQRYLCLPPRHKHLCNTSDEEEESSVKNRYSGRVTLKPDKVRGYVNLDGGGGKPWNAWSATNVNPGGNWFQKGMTVQAANPHFTRANPFLTARSRRRSRSRSHRRTSAAREPMTATSSGPRSRRSHNLRSASIAARRASSRSTINVGS